MPAESFETCGTNHFSFIYFPKPRLYAGFWSGSVPFHLFSTDKNSLPFPTEEHGTDIYMAHWSVSKTNCKENSPVGKLYQQLYREYSHSISISMLGSNVNLPASVLVDVRSARVSEEKWRVVILSHQFRRVTVTLTIRTNRCFCFPFLVIHGDNWWNYRFRCLL